MGGLIRIMSVKAVSIAMRRQMHKPGDFQLGRIRSSMDCRSGLDTAVLVVLP